MLWIVAGLIAATLAITALAAVRLRSARRALARCREWNRVTGRVIASSIREVVVHDLGAQYAPIVVYRYVVGDIQYESDHLTLGDHAQYSRRRSAERRIARYVVGQPVDVRVDPANPARAALECQSPEVTMFWTVLVVIWVVMIGGIGLLVLTPGVVGPDPILRL